MKSKNTVRQWLIATLLLTAGTTSLGFAAPNQGKTPPNQQKQVQQKQQKPQNQQNQQKPGMDQRNEVRTVEYYDGDPLNGGKLLKTETLQQPTAAVPFASKPASAKFAVVKDDRGAHIVDLSKVPPQGQRPEGKQMQNGQKGPQEGRPMGGERGRGPQGGPMNGQGPRGPETVTFYDGDPLAGGKVTATFQTTPEKDQRAELDAAAQNARFMVIEHEGEKRVIDLSKPPAGKQPGENRR